MIAVRVLVGILAVVGIAAVLASMLRTVVLPRAVPARLARIAFLGVFWLLRLRLRLTGRSDYDTRDRIFAVQAPLGLFAQLVTWAVLIWLLFAALFWSLTTSTIGGPSVSHALELSGSSMLTLGFDSPGGLSRQLAAFAAAGVGVDAAGTGNQLFADGVRGVLPPRGTGHQALGSSRRPSIRPGAAFEQLGARSLRSARGGVERLGRLVHRARRVPHLLPTARLLPVASFEEPLGAGVRSGAGRRRAHSDGLRRAATIPRRTLPASRSPRSDLDRRLPRYSPPPTRTRRGDHALEEKFDAAFNHLQNIGVPMRDDRESAWAAFEERAPGMSRCSRCSVA